MNSLTEQAATVLQEIDEQLALADKATAGPWTASEELGTIRSGYGQDLLAVCSLTVIQREAQRNAAFIASARTVCPTALRMLKTAIEGLLEIAESETSADPYEACNHPSDANETLTALINQWNSK